MTSSLVPTLVYYLGSWSACIRTIESLIQGCLGVTKNSGSAWATQPTYPLSYHCDHK